MSNFKIFHGDCLEVLQRAPSDSMDSIVCDPPYGLSFMGKKWDYDVPTVEIWKECLRVLKPGGHLLAFGGTRTYHRLVVAIEDAGFEIRDQIQWLYGQGFPKSQNLAKAAGDESLAGLGTALKPANEPICLARKPLSESTIAKNVIKHGTGGLNIEVSRVEGKLDGDPNRFAKTDGGSFNSFTIAPVVRAEGRFPSNVILDEDAAQVLDEQTGDLGTSKGASRGGKRKQEFGMGAQNIPLGFGDSGGASRFFKVIEGDKECSANTAKQNLNLLSELDDFVQDVVAISESPGTSLRSTLLAFTSEMQSELNSNGVSNTTTIQNIVERFLHELQLTNTLTNDPAIDAEVQMLTGTTRTIQNLLKSSSCVAAATSSTMSKSKEHGGQDLVGSRFLYQAKASKSDRGTDNTHPTVKPIKLMEYLIKLVTPEGGIVLDPFMGSGTTGVAALRNGFQFRGIEREENYYYISQARLEKEDQ